jgi:hypothetical protein
MSLKIKTLLIEIHLDKYITKSDVELRKLLVDTIESRGIGEVVEETSSKDMLEVVIEILGNEKTEDDLGSLLVSLGFNNYQIKDISNDDDE